MRPTNAPPPILFAPEVELGKLLTTGKLVLAAEAVPVPFVVELARATAATPAAPVPLVVELARALATAAVPAPADVT